MIDVLLLATGALARVLLFISLIAFTTSNAFAWGAQGHRITGSIAEQRLTPAAKREIRRLMGGTDLGSYALYMDTNKVALSKSVPGSREWHYDDKRVCAAEASLKDYCPGGNCASKQILRNYRTLIDQHSSDEEKKFGIYVLVHIIGDIHQPLHAADHDDRGGNDILVKVPIGNDLVETNLHSAWDTEFVRAALKETDTRKIARSLVNNAKPGEIASYKVGSPGKWIAESHELADQFAYQKLPQFACGDAEFAAERLDLSTDYANEAIQAVPTLLLKGGVRIAAVLNRALGR